MSGIWLPLCCAADFSAEFLDTFITSNLETSPTEDLQIVVVDSLKKRYDEASSHPMEPSSPNSPFKEKDPGECYRTQQQLVRNTQSDINGKFFAILDDRTLEDSSVLIAAFNSATQRVETVRAATESTNIMLGALSVGHTDILEQQGHAEHTPDKILRPGTSKKK